MSMLNESDWYVGESDYTPPRPVDEQCEDSPVEGGTHIRSLVSDKCIFCKREIET